MLATFVLRSADLPWAVYRVVGLVTNLTRQAAVTDHIKVVSLAPTGAASILGCARCGLGFDVANESLAALSSHPIIQSPSFMELTISCRESTAGDLLRSNSVLTAFLVVEVLADDEFGLHTRNSDS